MDNTKNILADYLELLGVPFTPDYCSDQVEKMSFRSLFGLSKLLNSYGIDTRAYQLADKSQVGKLPTPFIANTDAGLVIVTNLDNDNVSYLSQGVAENMNRDKWTEAWNGMAFCGFPKEDACEPDYKTHRRIAILAKLRDKGIVLCIIALFLYLFISNNIYAHVSTVLLTLFNLAGLYFTYLLVQKSLNIHNAAADAVCKVLQEGGCDDILKTQASKVFGFFGWSEVGFSYFSVSLLTLLIFPNCLPYLALFNACCLPYTFWSIWYQKFRAGSWCTLCVSVQCTLWCLFFCYLFGGWFSAIFPLRIEVVILGLTYLTVLLVLNKVSSIFKNEKD